MTEQRPTGADADAARRLSHQERSTLTRDLLVRARNARSGRERDRLLDRAVTVNLRVAESVAARYRNRGIALDDLRQAAYEGLIKAVRNFDPRRREELLTYAVPVIRGEVQRYFRDHGWMVRPPRRIQELQWRISRVRNRLEHRLGREPADPEVQAELGVSAEEYDEAMSAYGAMQPPSLDKPLGAETEVTLGTSLPDPADPEPAAEARAMLAPLVRRLSQRDRRILYLRFFEDQSQSEIGRDLGVSQMQVSRVLRRIYADLRAGLTPQRSDPSGRRPDDGPSPPAG